METIKTYKKVNSYWAVPISGVNIQGQNESDENFIDSLRIDEQWTPFGYELTHIVRLENSINVMAKMQRIER